MFIKDHKWLSPSIFIALLIALVGLWSGCERNTQYDKFSEVKKILLEKVYYDHRKTFYCNCAFSKKKTVRCKVGSSKRAKVVEWEHIVPASRFGNTFKEWKPSTSWECMLPEIVRDILPLKCRKRSGRQNAQSQSKKYRFMESDMYNLVPAIGYVNQKRSNLPYGEVPGEERKFGRCDFEIAGKIAEPTPGVRGNIARTYFYMDRAYPKRINLTGEEKKMFQKWDESDPVNEWECTRCKRIEALQGNKNPIVKDQCRKKGLW